MKILVIRGLNIASLEGKFEVNFHADPLKSAGIFAITGPTGSGKSSLLDTLCLALFENTPRLMNAGTTQVQDVPGSLVTVGNPASLLRKGATEGYAEVEFIGIDNKCYQATWSVRRAYGRISGALQNSTMRLKNVTDDLVFGSTRKNEIKEEISRVLGLTYEQFTRSVLLAQGEFASFLKAKDDQRASLLEKLTGTELYSRISSRIYLKYTEIKSEYEELFTRIREHNILTEEEFTTLQTMLSETENAFQQINSELTQKKSMKDWYELESAGLKKLEATRLDLERLQSEEIQLQEDICFVNVYNDTEEIRPLYQTYNDRLLQIKKLLDERDAYLKSSKDQEDRCIALVAQQNLQKTKLTGLLEEEPLLMSQLKEVRLLDTHIETTEKNLVDRRKSITKKSEEIETYQKNISALENKINSINVSLEEVTKWFNSNKQRERIALSFERISDQLTQSDVIRKELAVLNGQFTTYKSEIDEKKNEQLSLEKQLTAKRESAVQSESKIKTLSQLLEKRPLQTIRSTVTNAREERLKIQYLVERYSNIIRLRDDLNKGRTDLDKQKKEYTEITGQLQLLQNELVVLEGKRDQARKSDDLFKMTCSESVTFLRSSLKPESPCPVCGSISHPYAERVLDELQQLSDQYQNELSDAEKRVKEKTELQNRYQAKLLAITSIQNDLQERITTLEQNLTVNLREVAEYTSELAGNSTELSGNMNGLFANPSGLFENTFGHQENDPAHYEQVIELLKEKILNLDKVIKDAEEETEHAEKITKELAEHQQTYADFQREEQNIQATILTIKVRLQALSENIGSLQTQIKEKQEHLRNALNLIDGYFNNGQWQENWLQNPTLFISRLEEFAKNWKEKTDEKSQLEKLLSESGLRLETEKKLYEATHKEYGEEVQRTEELNNNLLSMKENRKQYFEGKSADETEDSFNRRKQAESKRHEDLQQQVQNLKVSIEKSKGELSQVLQKLHAHEAEKEQLEIRISEWIQVYTRSHPDMDADYLRGLLNANADLIQEKRIRVDSFRMRLSNKKTEEALHLNQMQIHSDNRPKDILPLAEVDSVMESLLVKKNEIEQKRSELLVKKRMHENAMESVAYLQKKIDETKPLYENWSKLNAELGQQNGGKFKLIAQSFTLDHLLHHANLHIRQIAPRYLLQRIPETLSLQVIDKDMCDQVRSVHSLSGGETFLVSLSLALGLSSLSSGKMNVESLFIDEGFGSLDEDSLSAAMDALESLRLQGRKVGVITHVKEMTERISTRIVVRKGNSGASHISVV